MITTQLLIVLLFVKMAEHPKLTVLRIVNVFNIRHFQICDILMERSIGMVEKHRLPFKGNIPRSQFFLRDVATLGILMIHSRRITNLLMNQSQVVKHVSLLRIQSDTL